MKPTILAKMVIMAGMALWMSSIVLNNIVDAGTNIFNIENTITMTLLKNDAVLGLGLKWRAWNEGYGALILKCIVAYQLLIVMAFWLSACAFLRVCTGSMPEIKAIKIGTFSLIIFSILWIGFLCGGTWFGYWIKQGAFTGVHMNMLSLTVVLLIFINQPCQLAERANNNEK